MYSTHIDYIPFSCIYIYMHAGADVGLIVNKTALNVVKVLEP